MGDKLKYHNPSTNANSQQLIVVLVSGNGSNLQAIIEACVPDGLLADAKICLVVSNRIKAFGLQRAKSFDIPTLYHALKPYTDTITDATNARVKYDADLADKILDYVTPDLIVLAGWMHILTETFLNRFCGRVINLHPALPGTFDGTNAIERALYAYKQDLIQYTGVMVHHVTPDIDNGSVICTENVAIFPTDTLTDLKQRIHAVEHRLLVRAICVMQQK
jgi:formyltetrahydrofolate-dependent phosphoribosylglycinamide formyltransferase